jgi:hypothetical protein
MARQAGRMAQHQEFYCVNIEIRWKQRLANGCVYEFKAGSLETIKNGHEISSRAPAQTLGFDWLLNE